MFLSYVFHLSPVLGPIDNVSNRGVQTSDDVAVELKNPTGSQNSSEKVKMFSFEKIIGESGVVNRIAPRK